MRVLSWNILNGGDDGGDRFRWRSQAQLIRELNPDVLLMQEARHFAADGGSRLFQAEADLRMRSLLAVAPHTGQHTAVFLHPDLRPVRFEPDAVHFHHALAHAHVAVPGLDEPVQLASMHLSPLSPALRTAEVGWLAGLAAPGTLALVAGDANSLAPGDPEPPDWAELPAFQRVRYLDLTREPRGSSARAASAVADRTALAFLHAAGLVDAARGPGSGADGTPVVDTTPTVPTRGYPNAEFVAFRGDHVLLSPALAAARVSYQVVQDDRAHSTSDHLPVLVELDLSLLADGHAATA